MVEPSLVRSSKATLICLQGQLNGSTEYLSDPTTLKPLSILYLVPINTRLHTTYMPTYGSSRRMSYQQECMQVRPGPLPCSAVHIFNRRQMDNCIQKWLLRFLRSML
eukprot:1154566-Pelagomonas_calceolata.AAC.1